jgi:hypothetical protein
MRRWMFKERRSSRGLHWHGADWIGLMRRGGHGAAGRGMERPVAALPEVVGPGGRGRTRPVEVWLEQASYGATRRSRRGGARLGSARRGNARPGMAWLRRGGQGAVCPGEAQRGAGRFRLGDAAAGRGGQRLAGYDKARPVEVWPVVARSGAPRRSTHGQSWLGAVWPIEACRGVSSCGGHGMSMQGEARSGQAWRGLAVAAGRGRARLRSAGRRSARRSRQRLARRGWSRPSLSRQVEAVPPGLVSVRQVRLVPVRRGSARRSWLGAEAVAVAAGLGQARPVTVVQGLAGHYAAVEAAHGRSGKGLAAARTGGRGRAR